MATLRPLTFLVLLLVATTACCGTSEFSVKLRGADDLNPDPFTKTPSPVSVRAYLTRTRDKVTGLDFEALWTKEGEALAGDVVNRVAPVDVYPGKDTTLPLVPGDGAKFLTLVARFNKIEGNDWKVTMDFDQAQVGPIELKASSIKLPPPKL